MALEINISSSIQGILNPVRWDLIETSTGVKIDEHTEAGSGDYNFAFTNNIIDVVYTIRLYEVPGGVGLGSLKKPYNITVSTSTLSFDSDIELIVDGGTAIDPVAGTSATPDMPTLIGKDYYVVQRGIGQLLQTRNIEVIPDIVD